MTSVLFMALAVNAINPNPRLPEVVYQLEAVLFVSFSLGIGTGLLMGRIPIPLPGGIRLFRRRNRHHHDSSPGYLVDWLSRD